MNILNVNSYYFSSTVYKPLEDALKNRGYNIKTYVPVAKRYKVREEITFELPEHVNVSKCFNNIDRILFHYKHLKIKQDFFKNYYIDDYDIIHAHSLFSNGFIAYKAFEKYKIPYIVAVRSTDMNLFFKKMPYLRGLGRSILLNAYKVIFLSTPYKNECVHKYIPKQYRRLIKNKSVVIPNGIDEFWFCNKVSKSKSIRTSKINLLFVGNDSKRKNLKTLIEACEILVKSGYNLKLTVVGKIENKQLLRELKQKEYIRTTGRVDKEQLLSIYRNNNIFVLPSITETFGLVYAEAMTQALPVIYTRGQGFDGQFKDGLVGYPVNCYDPNDIVKKILLIIDSYNELSKRCLNFVDKFKWDYISNVYTDIYDGITNK